MNICDRSNTAANKAYCNSMYQSYKTAAEAIRSGSISDFSELWVSATRWRISRLGDPGSDGSFSKRREVDSFFCTPLAMPYRSVLPMILNHPEASDETHNCFLGAIECKVYRQHGYAFGVEVPLTVASAAVGVVNFQKLLGELERRYGSDYVDSESKKSHPNMIHYPDPEQFDIIDRKLEELFSTRPVGSSNKTETLAHVASVHWWAASAAMDQRGSAAKAEYCARAVAAACGLEFAPFKHGFVPDLQAMMRSENEFVRIYADSFEKNPLH